ncbi:MAG: hypothetical protein ABW043_16710 [Devosia sp.]|uniref:hypothetical protein n=1 Tax=Devosia sp. TaxID=1871048 RepID=UPI0033907DB3
MSVPTEADFAIIKPGDGATPTEVFNAICGIENVSVNVAVSGTDRYRRDCAKPGALATRKNITNGISQTITGGGAMSIEWMTSFAALLGTVRNYKIELRQRNGSDAGLLLGTFAGAYVMMTNNITTDSNGNSSGEITLNSEGAWTWTPAS